MPRLYVLRKEMILVMYTVEKFQSEKTLNDNYVMYVQFNSKVHKDAL